ncbi:MAG: FHA domain-containing protein [Coleofasciculaceae cyanobacterium]
MNEITIEWQEAGQIRQETIRDNQPSKYPGMIRLGRDPLQCDIVLNDPTVSGLHVEIFFNNQYQSFALHNLRDTNPPVVDGREIKYGEAFLSTGSSIYLGQLAIVVAVVSLHQSYQPIPPTQLVAPQSVAALASYGLQCPNCGKISPYERLDWGCQWCGTSLAAAASIVMSS